MNKYCKLYTSNIKIKSKDLKKINIKNGKVKSHLQYFYRKKYQEHKRRRIIKLKFINKLLCTNNNSFL